jgi:single-stranded-DNA-specific exonuclease
LKDRFHRPTVIFARGSEGELKGSARSVNGVNIRDVLAAIDVLHPGLILKFGGHAMAAGLSLAENALAKFQHAFIAEVSQWWDLALCSGEILSDGPLAQSDLNLDFAETLHAAGPWGQQFPEPVFDNRFIVCDQRLVGKNHLKLMLQHEAGGAEIDAIAFQVDTEVWPNHRARMVHVAYKLDINHYRGRRKLQLIIEALQVSEVPQLTAV